MLEIELPVDFIVDLSAQATQIVADLFPVWALVGGIALGLAVVLFVIEMFTEGVSDSKILHVLRGDRITKAGVDAQAAAGLFDFDDDDELQP